MPDNNFLIYIFDNENENKTFSERNQDILQLLNPKLNNITDKIFRNSVSSNRPEITIFMLGRLCVRHFESILLLCSNGHGFAAYRILRSMFEKYVDAKYLHKNPQEIDDFWDFYLLQVKKTKGEDFVKKLEPNYENIIKKFEQKKGRKTNHRINWSKKSLKTKANEVGIGNSTLNRSYNYANLFVHSSVEEMFSSLILETDNSISPVESTNNEIERKLSSAVFIQAIETFLGVLDTVDERYSFGNNQMLQEFNNELVFVLKKRLNK